MTVNGKLIKQGDWISLDGSTGSVYEGSLPTQDAELDADFTELMKLADKHTRMNVRTNADTPREAKVAVTSVPPVLDCVVRNTCSSRTTRLFP